MGWLHIILLSLIQGITEFLPISSSGHLILLPRFLGVQDHGVYIDLASHLGTLIAVVLFFRSDLRTLTRQTLNAAKQRDSQKLLPALAIVVATLPIIAFGILVFPMIKDIRDNLELMIFNFVFWGIVLYIADKFQAKKTYDQMRLIDALGIGLAQILALLPGTSRSGITMTMGRFLGLDRDASARFSLLLAIPTTAAAVAYPFLKSQVHQWELIFTRDFLAVCLLSAFFAYITLKIFLSTIKKTGFFWYALYRVALGLFLYILFV